MSSRVMAARIRPAWRGVSLEGRFDPPVSDSRELSEALLDARLLQPPPAPGTLATIDRFQIVREVGSGGMGVVLLARDPQRSLASKPEEEDLVVLKVLRPELAGHPRSIERFLGEARHMQKFRHAHILPVLEVGASSRRPYLVMPHLRRGSLARLLRQHGPLEERATLRVGLEVASALHHAHARGIIHRDLKPANVLLDDSGRAVLTDFGLARTVFNDGVFELDAEHCEGTAPYMSPAVARGEAEDTRCDIYAFGALLFEVLTGRPPYRGATSAEITRQIVEAPPPPVRSIQPTASLRLTRIAEWAMARELRHRYAHILDVIHDLQRVESNLDPLGPSGRSGLFQLPSFPCREIRIPLGLMAAAAVALLAVPLLILTLSDRSRRSWTDRRWELRLAPVELSVSVLSKAPLPSGSGAAMFLVHDRQILLLGEEGGAFDGALYPPLARAGRSTPEARQLQTQRRFQLPTAGSTIGSSDTALEEASVDLVLTRTRPVGDLLLVRAAPKHHAGYTHLCCYDLESATLRWVHQDLGGILPPRLVQLETDGSPEILVATGASASRSARVQRLDDSGQVRDSVPLPRNPVSFLAAGRSESSALELLILDEAAWLHVLDSTLRCLRSIPLGQLAPAGAQLQLHAVADLDSDLRPEWILSATPSQAANRTTRSVPTPLPPELLIVDPDLHLLARAILADDPPAVGSANVRVGDVMGDDRPEIVWQGGRQLVLEVYKP